jgi:hypothetical protein
VLVSSDWRNVLDTRPNVPNEHVVFDMWEHVCEAVHSKCVLGIGCRNPGKASCKYQALQSQSPSV